MEQPAGDVRPGAVLQVLQTGYELFAASSARMVVVSAKGSAGAAPADPVAQPPATRKASPTGWGGDRQDGVRGAFARTAKDALRPRHVGALPTQDDEEGWAALVFRHAECAPFARVSKHAGGGSYTA